MRLYYEGCYPDGQDNEHPRGMIGAITANRLLRAGWTEREMEGYGEHFWVDPDGELIGSLEFAFKRAFGE